MMRSVIKVCAVALMLGASVQANAQRYNEGLIDKVVAVVGGEAITLSSIESEVQMMRARGMNYTDNTMRCEILEQLLSSKLFIMQAKIDSLSVNADMVESSLSQQVDQVRSQLGGDQAVEEYFGKSLYKLRQEWKTQFQEQSLIMQAQSNITSKVPEMTPYDVKAYLDTVDATVLPVVPIKYQLSQICIYPDRETAALEVKERLLSIRERIMNGERFATLARIYSEDPGSARNGGELGMTAKSSFWPAFSDAAMSLKPGTVSQIVETPDGFHLIEVLEKDGDMFNARHILLKPKYTSEDREKAFSTLDSIKTAILDTSITFELAARFYSEDLPTLTNGGQMADPNTGSAYFEIDQLKPADYAAIKDLKEGEISEPVESTDNEGRGNVVYKILRLDRIVPSHTASFENDFTELAATVKIKAQTEALDEYVAQRVKATSIVIDKMFEDCDFSRDVWKEKLKK